MARKKAKPADAAEQVGQTSLAATTVEQAVTAAEGAKLAAAGAAVAEAGLELAANAVADAAEEVGTEAKRLTAAATPAAAAAQGGPEPAAPAAEAAEEAEATVEEARAVGEARLATEAEAMTEAEAEATRDQSIPARRRAATAVGSHDTHGGHGAVAGAGAAASSHSSRSPSPPPRGASSGERAQAAEPPLLPLWARLWQPLGAASDWLLALWARVREAREGEGAIERELFVADDRRGPTRQELRDLSKLWLMLSFRLQGRAGREHGRLSAVRLSWGEFQLAFGDSWHAMVVKRVFDLMDRDQDGVICFEDFARGIFPLASAQASLEDKLHFLFECLDLDGSGAISREDLLVHLHLYSAQSLCANDCSFTPEQLEALISATFASAELDTDGRIRRRSFTQLLSSRPGLTAALRQRLSINVNQTIANLILDLDERWLEVGPPHGSGSPPRGRGASSSSSASASAHHGRAGRSWCDSCTRDVTHWLRRSCCRGAPAHRRRAWDSCLKQIRARFRDKTEYVPTLMVIVP